MPDSFNPIAKPPPGSESKSSSPSNLAKLNLQLKRIGKKVNFRQPSLLAGFGEKRRSIGELKSSSLSLDRDYDGTDGTEPGSRRDSDTIRTAHSEGSKEELNKRERLRKQRRQSEDTVLELEGEDLLL